MWTLWQLHWLHDAASSVLWCPNSYVLAGPSLNGKRSAAEDSASHCQYVQSNATVARFSICSSDKQAWRWSNTSRWLWLGAWACRRLRCRWWWKTSPPVLKSATTSTCQGNRDLGCPGSPVSSVMLISAPGADLQQQLRQGRIWASHGQWQTVCPSQWMQLEIERPFW